MEPETIFSKHKLVSQPELGRQLHRWRVKGERVVFTNGCFDLLHPGHVNYLERARSLGNRLVIGLNTDASVARLKPGRPIVHEQARGAVLAGLACVDALCLFDEDTPLALIEFVKPDVLVKGADYALEDIVGAPFVHSYGGQVQTLPFLEGYSTSAIVQKIKQAG